MAIRVEYRPNQTLMSMLQFFAGASEREREDERAQAQRRGQQSGQYANAAMSGIQGAMKMNAQRLDRENRLAVEQERTWRRQADTFQDEYGVTPGSLMGQIPRTGAGMLQRPEPGQAGEQVAMAGGQAGPPASMASSMQPIPQQGDAPLSQSQPPEAAGPQYYAQNPAVVPQMTKLKKRLDMFTTAKSLVESKAGMPDEEKAAIISMYTPHVAAMTKEYNALTKRYPAPKPPSTYQEIQQQGFAIDMPGYDTVWYKTDKGSYKPMTVHPRDSEGWLSEQDPEVREAKKVQHFQDNYHQSEDGTEFLFDGKKWNRQKAEKDTSGDYQKRYMDTYKMLDKGIKPVTDAEVRAMMSRMDEGDPGAQDQGVSSVLEWSNRLRSKLEAGSMTAGDFAAWEQEIKAGYGDSPEGWPVEVRIAYANLYREANEIIEAPAPFSGGQ